MAVVLEADVGTEFRDGAELPSRRVRECRNPVATECIQTAGTEDRWRNVGNNPIDEPRGQQRAVHFSPAFDERLQDTVTSEQRERSFEVDAPSPGGDCLDFRAPRRATSR